MYTLLSEEKLIDLIFKIQNRSFKDKENIVSVVYMQCRDKKIYEETAESYIYKCFLNYYKRKNERNKKMIPVSQLTDEVTIEQIKKYKNGYINLLNEIFIGNDDDFTTSVLKDIFENNIPVNEVCKKYKMKKKDLFKRIKKDIL